LFVLLKNKLETLKVFKSAVAAAAKELVDERREALGDGVQSEAVYLTYLLSNKNITLDEIYSNVMEMLFAGTDTVSYP